MADPDTIAAISTPPGRGGIGIVRLSGPDALSIAGKLVRLAGPLQHARARFVRVLDPRATAARSRGVPDGSGNPDDPDPEAPDAPPLDEAVITAFLAPNSYTTDDLVEIAAHGSPVVLDVILTAALHHGARLANPGEFTQRAFLAGRLDLTQAEAVHDLIAAQTLEQARAAAQQLGGALSRRLAPAKEHLLHLIALLEAGMDFASGELDDVDVVPPSQIDAEIHLVHNQLTQLAGTFRAGAILRSGVSLALVGRPNAGKSSLFNRLLERPRAIVTPIPGTTRDTVEESWSLNGIPVRLVDTAGLRLSGEPPADEAERQGIERSREALADADLVLLIHDAATPQTPEEHALIATLSDRPHLLVRNKIDLLSQPQPVPPTGAPLNPVPSTGAPLNSVISTGAQRSGETPVLNAASAPSKRVPPSPSAHAEYETQTHPPAHPIPVSALTGEGLDHLRSAILQALHTGGGLAESGALNNRRQQESVLAAIAALEAATEANASGLPHEALLLDLHTALQALDTLTGATTADDILARIFSTFCIGK